LIYHGDVRSHSARPAAIIIGILTSCLLCFVSPVWQPARAAYTFVDVGQGDCLHIRTADGKNYLMDGGGRKDYDMGKKTLLPYLLKNGVTHLDGV